MMVSDFGSRASVIGVFALAGLLISGAGQAVFAAETDWGGTLQSYVEGGNESENQIAAGVSAGLWMNSQINENTQFSMAGGYSFSYDQGDIFQYPVLNVFNFSGKADSRNYRIGRFTMSDRNGLLFNALLDGFDTGWTNENDGHRAGLGFTGFVFNRTSRVIMTSIDQKSLDNAGPFSLASPRMVLFYEYTRFLQSNSRTTSPLDHTLSVGVLGEFDARPESAVLADSPSSSVLHSAFLQVSARGLLSKTLLYRANIIGQVGSNDIPGENRSLPLVGAMAEASLTWIPSVALSPSIVGELLYSTGDRWGKRLDWEGSQYDANADSLHKYTAFTTRTVGYVYAPRVGNLMYARVGASIRPVQIFSLALDNYLVFRAVDGPVNSIPLQESDGDSLFLGDELILTADLRPLSDFGVSARAGVFIPNKSLLSSGIVYRLGATVSLSY